MEKLKQLFVNAGLDLDELSMIENDVTALEEMLNKYEPEGHKTNVSGWFDETLSELCKYIIDAK